MQARLGWDMSCVQLYGVGVTVDMFHLRTVNNHSEKIKINTVLQSNSKAATV